MGLFLIVVLLLVVDDGDDGGGDWSDFLVLDVPTEIEEEEDNFDLAILSYCCCYSS